MNALTKDDLKVDNTRLEKIQNLMLKAFSYYQKSPIDINTKKLDAQKLPSENPSKLLRTSLEVDILSGFFDRLNTPLERELNLGPLQNFLCLL